MCHYSPAYGRSAPESSQSSTCASFWRVMRFQMPGENGCCRAAFSLFAVSRHRCGSRPSAPGSGIGAGRGREGSQRYLRERRLVPAESPEPLIQNRDILNQGDSPSFRLQLVRALEQELQASAVFSPAPMRQGSQLEYTLIMIS